MCALVVLGRAVIPKVVRNAWEAPKVELDVRPYAAAAVERLVETATAVVRLPFVLSRP
jgi:hypothetical protein